MNRKKIHKILSSVVSGLYIANTSSVFALNNIPSSDIYINSEIQYSSEETIVTNSEELNTENSKESGNITETSTSDSKPTENIQDSSIKNESSNELTDTSNSENTTENESQTNIHNTSNDILIDVSTITDSNDISTLSSEDAYIPDENLLRALNKALSKGNVTTTITIAELENLTNTLDLSECNISDLSGIEYATNIKKLILSNNKITNLSPLSGLTNLTELTINSNQVTDISVLSTLTNLESIVAKYNNITDLSPIFNLSSLHSVDFEGNVKYSEADLNAISKLPLIRYVCMSFDIPTTDLIIGENGFFPNIMYLNLSKSNLNSLDITSASKLNYMESKYSTINEVSLNNSAIEYACFDYSTVGNLNIDNLNNLSHISFGNLNVNDLTVTNCSKLYSMELGGTNPTNVIFRNLPMIGAINLNNINAESVIVDDIKAYNYAEFKNSTIGSLTFSNSNTRHIQLTGSNINNITLDNLEYLNQLNISNLTNENLVLNNTPMLNYVNADGIKTNSLELKLLNNLGYLTASRSNIKTLKIEDCPSIKNIGLNNASIGLLDLNNLMGLNILLFGGATFDDINISNCSVVDYIDMDSVTSKTANINGLATGRGALNMPRASMGTLTLNNFDVTYINASNSTINNFNVLNMDNLMYMDINNIAVDNFTVENCPILGTFSNSSNKLDSILLKNLPNFQYLDVSNSNVNNLVIEECAALNHLNADSNNLSSIDTISAPALLELHLNNNNLDDISNIGKFPLLEHLYLDGNHITNISYLKDMQNLAIDNISVANQTITLNKILSKPGEVTIQYPNLIDYDGNKIPFTKSTKNTNNDILVLGTYEEGVHTTNIEFTSPQVAYSIIAAQELHIDGTAPTLNIQPNTQDYTNGSVTLNISVIDNETGVSHIKLPTGEIINSNEYSFKVTKNGDYEFEAVDLVGNSIKHTITVSNIDTEAPISNTSITYNDEFTEAIIKIEATDSLSGVLNITLPDGKVVETDTAYFTATKNGDYLIAVSDMVGNIYTKTIKIDSIKEIKPSEDNTDNDNTNNNPTDNPTDNVTDNNNNNDYKNNSDKLPNSSGLGVFAPIVAMMSLAIGAISFKKKNNL